MAFRSGEEQKHMNHDPKTFLSAQDESGWNRPAA